MAANSWLRPLASAALTSQTFLVWEKWKCVMSGYCRKDRMACFHGLLTQSFSTEGLLQAALCWDIFHSFQLPRYLMLYFIHMIVLHWWSMTMPSKAVKDYDAVSPNCCTRKSTQHNDAYIIFLLFLLITE